MRTGTSIGRLIAPPAATGPAVYVTEASLVDWNMWAFTFDHPVTAHDLEDVDFVVSPDDGYTWLHVVHCVQTGPSTVMVTWSIDAMVDVGHWRILAQPICVTANEGQIVVPQEGWFA